jgi:Meiotically up-regulated gene 113
MFVYVVQCTVTKNIKIGRTKKNPKMRISTLNTSAPYPLKTLYIFEDKAGTLESDLHKTFKSFNVHREWFKEECLNGLESILDSLTIFDMDSKTTPKICASKLKLEEKCKIIGKKTISDFFDSLITPIYKPFNPYIDRIWELVANTEGMNINDVFNKRLEEEGHCILLEAFSQPIVFERDLMDLEAYVIDVVKSLRNPVTPFSIFISDDEEKLKIWEANKQYQSTLATHVELLYDHAYRLFIVNRRGSLNENKV